MLSDSASSLFVPQRIRELSVGSGIVPYFNAGSEIFATRNLTSGDTWTATDVDLTAGQSGLAELIDAGAQLTDAQYNDAEYMKTIAAGGFRDITRIASSSPVMWQQICMENHENISNVLDDYIRMLIQIRCSVDNIMR